MHLVFQKAHPPDPQRLLVLIRIGISWSDQGWTTHKTYKLRQPLLCIEILSIQTEYIFQVCLSCLDVKLGRLRLEYYFQLDVSFFLLYEFYLLFNKRVLIAQKGRRKIKADSEFEIWNLIFRNKRDTFDCLLEVRKGGWIFDSKRQRVPKTYGGGEERMEVKVLTGLRDAKAGRSTGRICRDEV